MLEVYLIWTASEYAMRHSENSNDAQPHTQIYKHAQVSLHCRNVVYLQHGGGSCCRQIGCTVNLFIPIMSVVFPVLWFQGPLPSANVKAGDVTLVMLFGANDYSAVIGMQWMWFKLFLLFHFHSRCCCIYFRFGYVLIVTANYTGKFSNVLMSETVYTADVSP